MQMPPGLSGMMPPPPDKKMDDTAAEVAQALFLAGKINCDCEVCKLLVKAGTKMITQMSKTESGAMETPQANAEEIPGPQ